MATLHILLVTDDHLFSDVLLRSLRDQPEFTAVHCDNAARVPPASDHVAVLDAKMSGALALCDRLTARGHAVIFVGAPEDDQWAQRALAAGAGGVLTKSSKVDDVVNAIRIVHRGGVWAQRRWLRPWGRDLTAAVETPPSSTLDALLSRREREVFHGAAMGAANKELATRFSISEATVKAHLTRIFQKLGVTGRAELAAAYHGLTRRVGVHNPSSTH